jgi:hypothetical protein
VPPHIFSRHLFTRGYTDADGNLYLSMREKYGYRKMSDNRYHEIVQGDTLHGLAERYFSPLPEAAQLWWIIADFQPPGATYIHDPTLELTPGSVLVLPSVRLIQEEIFNPTRSTVEG